jgi:hypothetical protein
LTRRSKLAWSEMKENQNGIKLEWNEMKWNAIERGRKENEYEY